MLSIPRVYVTEPCPLDGYDSLSVRVLANPTNAEWNAYGERSMGTVDCADCAALNAPKVARGRRSAPPAPIPHPPSPAAYCPACTAARQAFGQMISTFYGPELLGMDISTPEGAIACIEHDDLRDELLLWLLLLPHKIWTQRHQAIQKNAFTSSSSASS